MTDKKETKEYQGEFHLIKKMPLTKIVTPTIYFGNIEGRKGEEEVYEWMHVANFEKGKNIQRLLKEYFLDQGLDEHSYAALIFPHVTTIFSFTNRGNVESNCESSLFNTSDLSPNPGIIRDENKITQCGLELVVGPIETSIWYHTRDPEKYYAVDRIPLAHAFEEVFGKMHLEVKNKLK